jgi:hypothetical protein
MVSTGIKRLLSLLLLVLLGCSLGPIHVQKREGKLPKLTIDTPKEECKMRGKIKEVKLDCKWRF